MTSTIRKSRLANGLTLLTESMPDVRSVCVGVWLKRGSRNERPRINGISHFIEHLVFKGTERRTAREIALTMDSVGGQMDAFTSKEYTCFYAKVLDRHLPLAMDLLSDIVQRPLFDSEEVERERQVVLEEIRMIEDTPDEMIHDLFFSHFYPRHALGRPIQGTARSVGAINRRQLLRFFRGSYRPHNLLIVAAGKLRHEAILRAVRAGFAGLDAGRPSNGRGSTPRTGAGLVSRQKPQLEQLHLLLGLPAYAASYRQRYPLYVLNTILGGAMSSRLFQKIREQRGLVYSVYSGVNTFHDSGFLTVYAATRPRAGNEVLGLILAELEGLRSRGVTDEELRVAKEHLKGSLMLSLESTSSRMSNLARQEIYYGRQRTLAETLRGVDAVSRRQILNLARKLLTNSHLALAAVGRVDRLRFDPRGLRL